MTAPSTLTTFRRLPLNAALALGLGLVALPAAAANKVIVTGTMIDRSDNRPNVQGNIGGTPVDMQTICTAANQLAMYSGMAQVELANQMAQAGLDSSVIDDASENLGEALDEVCNRDDDDFDFSMGPFVIVYASCMMRMESNEGTMAIRILPGGSEAVMEIADHASQEGTQFVMLANDLEDAAQVTGRGTSDPVNLTATGAYKEIANYQAQMHNFDYAMSLGGDGVLEEALAPIAAMGMGESLAAMTRVTSNGTVWIAPDAPGSDIVRDFYDNFASVMENAQGMGSFMAGTLRNLYGMVKNGMPLEIEQNINAAMGMSSYSWSQVESITLRPLDPSECGVSTIPATYSITDMNQEMAGAGPGASPGTNPMGSMSAEQQAEMNAAMSEANAAMQQAMQGMSKEQQDMLKGLGIGIPGGAAAAAANPSGGAASRSGPSSADLTTDNLVQTVQLHLQALGYDVGSTDGTESVETTIAISQFQAEKGMEVTGKITPQLAGILAAEVDSR